MDFVNVLEWVSVFLNLLFVIFIIKEKREGWLFGIIGSFLSIYLFYTAQLYSEAILYSYYVGMGIYGWKKWSSPDSKNKLIIEWSLQKHVISLAVGVLGTLALGYFFKQNTDAAMPFADAFSTIFSFIATYMETKKILSTWVYWIVLNTFSVWLYQSRGFEVYAALMIVYAVLSVVGLIQWRKSKLAQSAA